MYIDNVLMKRLQNNIQFYKDAAYLTNVPWRMIAAVHYRENSLVKSSPSNGGAFQNDPPLTLNEVTEICRIYGIKEVKKAEEDFFIACVVCGHILQQKAKGRLTRDMFYQEEGFIKDAFWGYNGRAYGSYKKSPYVSNDPKGGLAFRTYGTYINKEGQRVRLIDKDGTDGVPDKKAGAWIIYRELLGLFCEIEKIYINNSLIDFEKVTFDKDSIKIYGNSMFKPPRKSVNNPIFRVYYNDQFFNVAELRIVGDKKLFLVIT